MTVLESDYEYVAPATFLLPESESLSVDFCKASQLFWLSYSDILPQKHGVLYQHVEEAEANPVATTLQFEADNEHRRFTWQTTRADRFGRAVERLIVTPGEVSGQRFILDQQGIVREQKELDQAEVILSWVNTQACISSPEFIDRVDALRKSKEKAEHELARYSVMETFRHRIISDASTGKTELQSKQERVDHIGFTAICLWRQVNITV